MKNVLENFCFEKAKTFFKNKTNIIMISVIIILLAALSWSAASNIKRANAVKAANASISEEQEKLQAADREIADIKAQLEKEQQSNSELQAQLEAKQNEKSQLESEIAGLKQQIQELSAKKNNAANQAQPTVEPSYPYVPGRVCYLTFDDGPSDNTLRILDILNRYGIKATFFVTNSDKVSYIKNIYDAGHTVGLHTASHNYAALYSSVDAYFADLESISNTVEQITGEKSRVIRFPGGSSNGVSKKYCPGIMSQLVNLVQERGYSYFDWNVSSEDATGNRVRADIIRSNILKNAANKNSICVLMHDSSAKTTTADALPSVIEGLSAMGYTFDSIKPDTYGYHHNVSN